MWCDCSRFHYDYAQKTINSQTDRIELLEINARLMKEKVEEQDRLLEKKEKQLRELEKNMKTAAADKEELTQVSSQKEKQHHAKVCLFSMMQLRCVT